ncbi:MAG: MFS transporter [Candidatus Bathyarchaeia archaeon]
MAEDELTVTEYLERAKISGFHHWIFTLACLIYALAAMNVMLIGAALPAIGREWSLDPTVSGLLLSSGYLGMLIGALSFGIMADRIGRKTALLSTVAVSSVFTGLCSIAWDVASMSMLRFLAGIGLGGILPQPGVYVSEFIPADKRGKYLGLVETSWVYGALLAVSFPYALIPGFGWRRTFLVAFIPLILIPFILWRMPESFRYLELKGLKDRIITELRKYGLWDVADVSGLSLRVEAEPRRSVLESLRELWSPPYRWRTLVLWMGWAALVYTYHGIFQWLPSIYYNMGFTLTKSLYFVLLITLLQVPGYYSATFMLDTVGRKRVLAVYLGVAGIASLLFSMAGSFREILLWSGVISFFNLGAWAALYTYTPELYPTRIRGAGSGSAASMGRLAGAVAPTLTGYLWANWGLTSAFTAFALAHILTALVVGALGVETKRKTLEEISR